MGGKAVKMGSARGYTFAEWSEDLLVLVFKIINMILKDEDKEKGDLMDESQSPPNWLYLREYSLWDLPAWYFKLFPMPLLFFYTIANKSEIIVNIASIPRIFTLCQPSL